MIIIGFKSAGKTTLGPLIAENLGFGFDDLDRRLAEKASDELGENVDFREAFRKLGEGRFRELERALLKEAIQEDCLVLSVGGGTPLDCVASRGPGRNCVVYIRVPERDLINRIRSGGWPAYLEKEEDPEGSLRRLLLERIPKYEKVADMVVDNPDSACPAHGAEEVAGRIREWMNGQR